MVAKASGSYSDIRLFGRANLVGTTASRLQAFGILCNLTHIRKKIFNEMTSPTKLKAIELKNENPVFDFNKLNRMLNASKTTLERLSLPCLLEYFDQPLSALGVMPRLEHLHFTFTN